MGLQAQSLPGIYHRGGALLKNTWSPFIEISKGVTSISFLGVRGVGEVVVVHRVGYTQKRESIDTPSRG